MPHTLLRCQPLAQPPDALPHKRGRPGERGATSDLLQVEQCNMQQHSSGLSRRYKQHRYQQLCAVHYVSKGLVVLMRKLRSRTCLYMEIYTGLATLEVTND